MPNRAKVLMNAPTRLVLLVRLDRIRLDKFRLKEVKNYQNASTGGRPLLNSAFSSAILSTYN
jgi:hypothetical protein